MCSYVVRSSKENTIKKRIGNKPENIIVSLNLGLVHLSLWVPPSVLVTHFKKQTNKKNDLICKGKKKKVRNGKRQIPEGKRKVDLDEREMEIIKISQVTKRKEIKC